jgi:hypothetical protein
LPGDKPHVLSSQIMLVAANLDIRFPFAPRSRVVSYLLDSDSECQLSYVSLSQRLFRTTIIGGRPCTGFGRAYLYKRTYCTVNGGDAPFKQLLTTCALLPDVSSPCTPTGTPFGFYPKALVAR